MKLVIQNLSPNKQRSLIHVTKDPYSTVSPIYLPDAVYLKTALQDVSQSEYMLAPPSVSCTFWNEMSSLHSKSKWIWRHP